MIREFLSAAAIIGTLPNTIANGQTADAIPLMADLNFIVSQVNANAAPLANTALLNAANSFTAVQSGIAATNSANFPIASQVQNFSLNTLSSVLGTNSINARIAALPLLQYTTNQIFTFVPSQTNTGPVGIVIDSAGSSSVFTQGRSLIGGELAIGVPALVERDATKFNLLNPQSNWLNFTATLTLVGGAGNTVPTYTGQSFARYLRVGKQVFVDVDFTNSAGGTAGAGSGQLTVALPIPVSASGSTAGTIGLVGMAANLSAAYILQGTLAANAATMALNYQNAIATTASFIGDQQNDANRKLRLQFWYPVD